MRGSTWGIVFACACVCLPAGAAREWTGTTSEGARYRIMAPDGWRDGDTLVMYQHGLDFAPTRELPGLGPLRDVMLDQGYAIAASSFRQRGWALFHAVEDNRDLLEVFEREVGHPGEMLPFGGSMGGLIALRLAESHLRLTGVHPEFGPVTLHQLLACWATHDMAHIAQLSRIFTRANGRHVGPWRKYFSLLQDKTA